jgi:uncharacterized protein YcnI
VLLTGSDLKPVAGWPVVWSSGSASNEVSAPQGSVSNDTTFTNSDGVAEVTWTLGDAPETYYLDVWAARVASTITETVSPVLGHDLTVVVP